MRWSLSDKKSKRVGHYLTEKLKLLIFCVKNKQNKCSKTRFSLMLSPIPEYPWSLWIWTSDVKGAGTDAQVFLQIYGEKGKSDEIKLENNSDSFEQGQVDKFMVNPASNVEH